MKKIFLLVENNSVLDFFTDYQPNTEEFDFKNIIHLQKIIVGQGYNIEPDLLDKIADIFDEEDDVFNDSKIEYDINHWVANRSYAELVEMFENGEIVKPDMQRNFVWSNQRCMKFVQSILWGLPIPSIFLMVRDNNTYEIIDGYQRILSISNFIKGRPWDAKRMTSTKPNPAKIPIVLDKKSVKKSFKELDEVQKRKIMRTTVPVIEFRQNTPKNYDSKYIIFERINTGSETLTPMQIRKALSTGLFMKNLYNEADKNPKFLSLFSYSSRTKDNHVEAYLRVYAFAKKFIETAPNENGIKTLLNQFCEEYKDKKFDDVFPAHFDRALNFLLSIFNQDVFKRPVYESKNKTYIYIGLINLSIMDSFMSVLIHSYENGIKLNGEREILERYNSELANLFSVSEDSPTETSNPFSISTGSSKSIVERISLAKTILLAKE